MICVVRADFVLVYDEDMETIEMKKKGTLGPKPLSGKAKITAREKNEMWRQKFLTNLRKAGLEMEEVSFHVRHLAFECSPVFFHGGGGGWIYTLLLLN